MSPATYKSEIFENCRTDPSIASGLLPINLWEEMAVWLVNDYLQRMDRDFLKSCWNQWHDLIVIKCVWTAHNNAGWRNMLDTIEKVKTRTIAYFILSTAGPENNKIRCRRWWRRRRIYQKRTAIFTCRFSTINIRLVFLIWQQTEAGTAGDSSSVEPLLAKCVRTLSDEW